MKHKYFFLIILLLSVIYFTNGKPTEIADRIMIHAIGIDQTDAGYRVTIQVFSPEASGSETSVDPSKPNVTIVTGNGITVNDAVRKCFGKLGGNVFIGQNQIIMFGRNVDLSKSDEVFGFFMSSSETFLNVQCAAAENTAEEILKIPIPGNTITSEKYPQMISAAAENGRAVKTTFMDLLNGMESNDKTVILPVFSKASVSDSGGSQSLEGSGGSSSGGENQSDEKLPEAKLEVVNGAVFVDGKYTAEITYEQMGYTALLNGSGKFVHTDLTYEGKDFSKTFKLKSWDMDAEIAGEDIVFRIECRLSPKDSQLFSEISEVDSSNKAALALIQKKAQSLANDICEKFSPELLNADSYLKRCYPQIYLKYSDDLGELYKHIRFEVILK